MKNITYRRHLLDINVPKTGINIRYRETTIRGAIITLADAHPELQQQMKQYKIRELIDYQYVAKVRGVERVADSYKDALKLLTTLHNHNQHDPKCMSKAQLLKRVITLEKRKEGIDDIIIERMELVNTKQATELKYQNLLQQYNLLRETKRPLPSDNTLYQDLTNRLRKTNHWEHAQPILAELHSLLDIIPSVKRFL